jgi:hypothetical protein
MFFYYVNRQMAYLLTLGKPASLLNVIDDGATTLFARRAFQVALKHVFENAAIQAAVCTAVWAR